MDSESLRVFANSPALIALVFAALTAVVGVALVAIGVFGVVVYHLARAVSEAARRWDGRLPGAGPIVGIRPRRTEARTMGADESAAFAAHRPLLFSADGRRPRDLNADPPAL